MTLLTRITIVFAAFSLAACMQLPPDPETAQSQGKAKLLAVHAGTGVVTIRLWNGLRVVAANLELQEEQYCFSRLASRGTQSFSDYWINFDQYTDGIERVCHSYQSVQDASSGDARN